MPAVVLVPDGDAVNLSDLYRDAGLGSLPLEPRSLASERRF
jgi:hypothetical protein